MNVSQIDLDESGISFNDLETKNNQNRHIPTKLKRLKLKKKPEFERNGGDDLVLK